MTVTEVATKTGLTIQVLGPLRVERDGVVADLGGPKQRALLGLLIARRGSATPRDLIIESVWGEGTFEVNRKSFHTYISTLRSTLGDVVSRSGDTYRLDVDPAAVDAWVFEDVVKEAHRTLATDPQGTVARLREVLGWWRGRPYADLADIPELDAEIRQLEELRLAAVELRMDAELEVGRHASLVGELEALSEEHPMRERFRAQHMLALYRSGRQAEALRAFRRTERYLAEELGVEPSHELKEMELRILQQDDSLLVGTVRSVTQRLAFMVTEVDGWAGLWERMPQEMATALSEHDRILRSVVEANGGRVFKDSGEVVASAHPSATEAVSAAGNLLRELAAVDWGPIGNLKVRVGIDIGEVEAVGGEFIGPPVNRAARLCASGHGGQVLVSSAINFELASTGSPGVQVRQLGELHLSGMATSERVAQLVLEGLPSDFPPLADDAGSVLHSGVDTASVPGYEIRERIGEGLLGTVWRAYQPSVGREVAIKVIRPELAYRPEFVRRFEAESRTVARLSHPHIVPLIDFWRDFDSAHLVVAMLEGGVLNVEERWDQAAARALLGQVASALDYAHSMGVVHGDLKPGNILLDPSGNAYLSDFGIAARLVPDELAAQDDPFRSPEFPFTGPTVQSDLHAFGVIAGRLLGVDVGSVPSSASALLSEIDGGAASSTPPDLAGSRNPYKGLRAFDEADITDFFGRDTLVEELVTTLASRRFVAVIGASGSGKSSVVRAGLIAAMERGAIEGSENWARVVMTPGQYPVESLADAISLVTRQTVTSDEILDLGIAGVIEGDVLLVVDQWEEVYTLADPGEAEAFVATIAAAVTDDRVRVVITIRADFYDRPLEDARLGALVRDGLVTVLRPSGSEAVEMITRPALGVGLTWDPALPHLVATDFANEPGGLPLLQYALTEMFIHRAGNHLEPDDYARIGGIGGALASRAEETFASLTEEQQQAAKQILLRLVTVSEEADDTRRRARVSELEMLDIGRSDLALVLDTLVSSRLLSTDRDPATRGPTVEVAHEALLREWPRMRSWIDDERGYLLQSRRFRAALEEWESSARNDDYLLSGERLAPFVDWAENSPLTSEETAYYRASRTRDDAQRNARRRRRRVLTGILAVSTAVASSLGVVAMVQSSRATAEATRSRAGELSAAAAAVVESDPALAKLLALSAMELGEASSNTLTVLHRALALSPVVARFPMYDDYEYLIPDIHPTLPRIVASPQHLEVGHIQVYDYEAARILWQWAAPSGDVVVGESRFYDGATKVVSGAWWWPDVEGDPPVPELVGIHIRNAETGDVLRRIDVGRCGALIHEVAANVALVATSDAELCDEPYAPTPTVIEIVDLDTGARVEVTPVDGSQAAISGDGRWVAVDRRLEDGSWSVVVYDWRTGEIVLDIPVDREFAIDQRVWVRMLNQDGSLLLLGERPIEVWDVNEGVMLSTFSGHPGGATPWAFSSDGLTVYSIGEDSTLRVWNAPRGTQTGFFPGVGRGRMAMNEHGRVVTSDFTAREFSILDLTPGEVWGLPSCGGFVFSGTLQVAGGRAVFSEVCPDGSVVDHVVDLASRILLSSLPNRHAQDMGLSPDGNRLVRQESPPGMPNWLTPPRVRDVATGDLLVEFKGVCLGENIALPWQQPGCSHFPDDDFAMWSLFLGWSPGAEYVAGLVHPGMGLAVWDPETGEILMKSEPCRDAGDPSGLVLTDTELLVFCWLGMVARYSTTDWTETVLEVDLPDGVYALMPLGFIDGGSTLIATSGRGSSGPEAVHWLDPETFEVTHTVGSGQVENVNPHAISKDAELVATGSFDGYVRVWSTSERRLTQEIFVGGVVAGVAFLDNNQLVVTPRTGGFFVYTLDPDELADLVRASLTRGFTPGECERFSFGSECPTLEDLKRR